MADIAQVIATGGTALVSAAAGAGLAYWLGALNRRHQEAREDRTRWYQDRFRAYADFTRAYANAYYHRGDSPEFQEAVEELATAVAPILFVGSPEAAAAAVKLQRTVRESGGQRGEAVGEAWRTFERAARKDLGHPSP